MNMLPTKPIMPNVIVILPNTRCIAAPYIVVRFLAQM
jgi:hypothetical protein